MIDHELVERLTLEYGGPWGINHTRRLLNLIEVIGEGLEYNQETVWLAAYLHDWGAYAPWAQDGVDHVDRSVQVAGEFLSQQGLTAEQAGPVLECIEFHHGGKLDRSLESILLSDADALDFLGATGVLREFSKNPRNLKKAFDTCQARMEKLRQAIILDRSKAIAQVRLDRMTRILADFQQETASHF